MVNFGIVYGITPFGLSGGLGIANARGGEEIIADYKARFAGITTFLQECVEQADRIGYVADDARPPAADRRHRVHQPVSARALAERIAINTVVQGSAADLIKLAMIDLQSRSRSGRSPVRLKMLLQIHDELVFSAPSPRRRRPGPSSWSGYSR